MTEQIQKTDTQNREIEEVFQELDTIAEKLESGDTSLEDSMSLTVIATGFDSPDGTPSQPVSKTSTVINKGTSDTSNDKGDGNNGSENENDESKDDGFSEEEFDDIINILKKSRPQH